MELWFLPTGDHTVEWQILFHAVFLLKNGYHPKITTLVSSYYVDQNYPSLLLEFLKGFSQPSLIGLWLRKNVLTYHGANRGKGVHSI